MVAGARWFRRGRPEARLDPVRWRRPGRAALLRSATVALLVAVAGLLAWSGPSPCTPGPRFSAAPGPPGPSPSTPAGSEPGAPALADPGLPEPSPALQRAPVPAGSVGVPLRLADPAVLALVVPGDRVDVLRVEDSGPSAEVASDALVLGVTDAGDFVTAGLLVAVTPAEAERAVAHHGRGFAVLLRPG